ncbi:MAG: LysE family translocator [Candidatus Limnocylindria bacterium]
MESILAFIGVSLLIIVAPGPDLMLVTRSVLAGGRRAGLLTALGIGTGSGTWALIAAAGLATLLATSPDLLGVIRWAGAGYLAWLGIRALLGRTSPPPDAASAARGTWRDPYRTGLVGNFLHPGQVVFYTSILPQFIDPTKGTTVQALGLGAIFALIALTWFSAYALVASAIRLRRWERAAPLLTRVTGVVLIGFAVRLAGRL